MRILSKRMARASLRIYTWSIILKESSHDHKNIQTTAEQLANRLKEYCIDQKEYWLLIDNGIIPYHAFKMITNNIKEDFLC